jgi:Natural resistance-associated macrophage protein
VTRYISVPLAALVLIALPIADRCRQWQRAMNLLVAASLVALPLLVLARHSARWRPPRSGRAAGTAEHRVHGHHPHRHDVTPWQPFFQQSNVVDERITARWPRYELADTAVGTVLFALGAMAILITCVLAFAAAPLRGAFVDAETVAEDLRHQAGQLAGALFAVALPNGSFLSAAR